MTATALGSLTTAVALLAGMSGASAQAVTPAAPLSGAGSFPGSFIVPGTNTSLHVGGVVQLDMYYTVQGFGNPGGTTPGGLDNGGLASIGLQGNGVTNLAGHTNSGAFRETAQNSRPSVETRTPTAYGELKTFWEINFSEDGSVQGANSLATDSGGQLSTPLNEKDAAALSQAYGSLGPWLFGMTNSTFSDLAAWPDTLDGGGEAGDYMNVATRMQSQVRYTWLLPNGLSEAVGLESDQSGGIVAGATGGGAFEWNDVSSPSYSIHVPALVSATRIDAPWGHADFHVAVAETRFKNEGDSIETGGTANTAACDTVTAAACDPGAYVENTFGDAAMPTGANITKWGYQVAFSGHLNTIGRDKMTWTAQTGQGAAQYNAGLADVGAGTQWYEGMVCSTSGALPYSPDGAAAAAAANSSIACSQPRSTGVNLSYTHYWTNEWRSTIAGGYDWESRPNAAATWAITGSTGLSSLQREEQSEAVNIMWTPVPAAQFGIEYEHYHRTVWSGAHGTMDRIRTQALFQF